MRKLLLVALATIPLAPGCAAILGVGAGVLISQEVIDSQTYIARLQVSSQRLWPTAKATLSHMSLKPLDVDDDIRVLIADVDQAKVTVAVETYDIEESVLRVSAKKYGVANGEIAQMVLDKVIDDLER